MRGDYLVGALLAQSSGRDRGQEAVVETEGEMTEKLVANVKCGQGHNLPAISWGESCPWCDDEQPHFAYLGRLYVRPCERGTAMVDNEWKGIESWLPDGFYMVEIRAVKIEDPIPP